MHLTAIKSLEDIPTATLPCSNKTWVCLWAPRITWKITASEIKMNSNQTGKSLLFLTKSNAS